MRNLYNLLKTRLYPFAVYGTLFLATPMATLAQTEDDLLNSLQGQADPEPIPVHGTFAATTVINTQSSEVLGRNVLEFRVAHRFGPMFGDDGGYHNWFGLDNLSDIRIGLEYGVIDRLMVGVGRSKAAERFDGFVKYQILRQSIKNGDSNSKPLTLTVYANAAIASGRNSNDAFGQPRFPDLAARMSYTVQLIGARKFGNRFSLALSPTVVYQNYASAFYYDANGMPEVDDNLVMALTAALRFKITPSFSLVADYTQIFSSFRQNHPDNLYKIPIGFGAEFELGGHVFQLNLSNAGGILPNEMLTNTTTGWEDGEFRLGFCITRVFTPGKKINKAKGWKVDEAAPAVPPVEDQPMNENQE